jgi:AbrB family looped-hinge helix DNA binding protein
MYPATVRIMPEDPCCGDGEAVQAPKQTIRVEGVASIDDRGQMVIPKAIRDRMGLKAGDKLAISIMESDGRPCCLTLIRTEELADRVRDILGPAMNDIL